MAEKIIRGPEQKLRNISFGALLLESLKKGETKTAMIDGLTGEQISYNELLQKTVSLVQHLKKFGLKKNDVISISSENSIYFDIPVIAAIFLGVVVAPLNHVYTERELLHVMNISKPSVIFCSSSVINKIINTAKQTTYVKKIILINKDSKLPKTILRLDDLITLPLKENFDVIPLSGDHVLAILYSSGTTGLPKGVMLTNIAFNASSYYLSHPDFANFNSEKIALCLLPFYHGYGFTSHLCMHICNMKIVTLPKFEEKLFLETIQNYKVTYSTLVPPLILFMTKSPLISKYDLSSLKEIVSGAAPLSKYLHDEFTRRLNILIRQGYGLTEMTLAVSLTPYDIFKKGSVGILIPGMECKVVDLKSGESLGPNQVGELCFRGVQIMKGYLGNPEETAATIDKDGWLHTGDVGYYDDEEYLYIVDRFKELIKYKGFQVPPAEIEGILLSHPGVLDCAVIGKPDDKAGELPLAFIVPKPKAKVTAKEIYDFVAQNVSVHKRLYGGVRFVESIPKNPTGKILRRSLKEQLTNSNSKL